MKPKRKSRHKSNVTSSGKDRNYFTIKAKLLHTSEVFPTKNVYNEMKIEDLKNLLEFTTGIPVNLQRLTYLDDGELLDTSDIRSCDIVANATVSLQVWPMWRELVEAAAQDDAKELLKLGITQTSDYKTPNSEYMNDKSKLKWFAERAVIALGIAAHRGHAELCRQLIKAGANVNGCTPRGRTALHIASAQGHGNIVDILLQSGCNIDAKDEGGNTALIIAESFGHKGCGRHLFLFRWKERARKSSTRRETPMMAHQFNDSSFPVWLQGGQAQCYLSKVLPPGDFEGTALNSPATRKYAAKSFKARFGPDVAQRKAGEEFRGDGKLPLPAIQSSQSEPLPPSFDQWLNVKKSGEQNQKVMKKKVEEEQKMAAEEKMSPDSKNDNEADDNEDDEDDEEEKRDEFVKTESYESWLAQQESEKKAFNPRPKDFKIPEFQVESIDSGKKKEGALRTYLNSLLEGKKGSLVYDEWLVKKEIDMLDSVEKRPVLHNK